MKDKALLIVSADGRKEDTAEVERVIAKLEKKRPQQGGIHPIAKGFEE